MIKASELRIGNAIWDDTLNKIKWVTHRRETFPNLDKYFIHGPLEVIRIDDGPEYAGGKFVICKYGYGEKGFYLNAVKKVKCS